MMQTVFFRLKKISWLSLLFYRLGDFYELFHDDAIEAARLPRNYTQPAWSAETQFQCVGFLIMPWQHAKTLIELGRK